MPHKKLFGAYFAVDYRAKAPNPALNQEDPRPRKPPTWVVDLPSAYTLWRGSRDRCHAPYRASCAPQCNGTYCSVT